MSVWVLFQRFAPRSLHIRIYGVYSRRRWALEARQTFKPDAGKLEIAKFQVQEGEDENTLP